MSKPTTVCFYSYKGGTGRSTALANVATYLASKGKKVGCIDLDIESPGLNYIFKVEPGERTITDLLTENILEFPELIPKCLINLKVDSSIDDAVLKEKMRHLSGEIYLMPATPEAGRISRVSYTRRLAEDMKTIINLFAEDKGLDYVLLDARSGMSDASIMAQIVSNIILFFFRLDRQGRKSAFSWISQYSETFGRLKNAPHMFLIASNVPTGGVAEQTIKEVNPGIAFASGGMKKEFDRRLDRESKLELEEEIIVLKDIKLESSIKTQYEQLGDLLLKYGV